jgi:hypothetical protein
VERFRDPIASGRKTAGKGLTINRTSPIRPRLTGLAR